MNVLGTSLAQYRGYRAMSQGLAVSTLSLLLLLLSGCGGDSEDTEAPIQGPSPEPTPTIAPVASPLPSPVNMPTPVVTPSPGFVITPSPEIIVLPTPTPVVTEPTPSTAPVASPVTLPSPTPSQSPTPILNPSPSPTAEPLNRTLWTLTASHNVDELVNAIDGDASTRWTTGQTQRPEQWLIIDLGATARVAKVVLNSDASEDDYPRSFSVQTRQGNGEWIVEYERASNGEATTEILLDGVMAQSLRIVQTGSSEAYWWSVHEIQVYAHLIDQELVPSPSPVFTPSPSNLPSPVPSVSPSPVVTPSPAMTPNPEIEPSPSPGAYERGVAVYNMNCASCHREIAVSDKRNRSERDIRDALNDIPIMRSINVTDDDLTALVIALNAEPSLVPSPSPVATPTTGASVSEGYRLYDSKGCVACHGTIAESSKRGAEVISIAYAIEHEVEMEGIVLTESEMQSIAMALADDEGVCRDDSDPGPVVIRRLSNNEYVNTVRDLLGVHLDPERLPGDSSAGNFTNIGSANVNSEHAIGYAEVVPEIADGINDTGNATAQRYVTCNVASGGQDCAATIVKNILPLAFRRDVSEDEVAGFADIFGLAQGQGLSPEESLAVTVEAILLSPNFTFIIEVDSDPIDTRNAHSLNGFELAARLSYFIWGSMPDEILFDLARSGELSDISVLNEQVERMLANEKSASLVNVFFSQWMRLVAFADPNNTEYAHIDSSLRADMVEETKQLFLKQFLAVNNDMRELLTTKTSYLNTELATHYGVNGPSEDGFAETLVAGTRSGILGHASVLASTAKENGTQPVARGKWVLDELLCESPRTPPPDVGELPEISDPNLTLKEQLAAHRSDPACAACHETMDPLGFGFENYDQFGLYRSDYENGHIVDSSGELPSGQIFTGTEQLAEILASDPRYLHCVTEKFFSYARGALAGPRDNCRVEQIAEEAAQSRFSLGAIVKAIVNNPAFLTRRSADAENGVAQ